MIASRPRLRQTLELRSTSNIGWAVSRLKRYAKEARYAPLCAHFACTLLIDQ
jgi:hypothetical protein